MNNKFSIRALISLTITISFIVMAVTGLVLYISPAGRDANWINWSMGGLLREQWVAVHTVFSWLFVITGALHLLVYNLKPLMNYLKDSAKKSFKMGAELVTALALSVIITAGTLFFVPPFSSIVEFGDKTGDSWVKKDEKPPVAHAELLSVAVLAEQVKVDTKIALGNLERAGIKNFTEESLVGKVAKDNKRTPRDIYLIMTAKQKPVEENKDGMGLGMKTFVYVCKEEGLDVKQTIKKLKAKGIKADASKTMKEIYLENGINPHEILKIMKEN